MARPAAAATASAKKKSRIASEAAAVAHKQYLTEQQERRFRYLFGDADLLRRAREARAKGESVLKVLIEAGSHGHGGFGSQKAVKGGGKKKGRKGDKRAHDHDLEEEEEDENEEQAEAGENKSSEGDEDSSVRFVESPPFVRGGKMRPYQIQGLNWLISLYTHGIHGILADEMGLGKTLQTLSLLAYLKVMRGHDGPHLLAVPKSTLHNWLNEARRWVPDLRAVMFHGDPEQRADFIKANLKGTKLPFDLLITSFETCLIEKAALSKVFWSYLIIDEAHRIKNEESLLSRIVRGFHVKHRLLLTGTPLQNNLHELWALLNFLLPDIFEGAADFDEIMGEGEDEKEVDGLDEAELEKVSKAEQDRVIETLRALLRPFLLRRLKADVEHSLLPKKEINLYVGMTPMQRQWYRSILERDVSTVNGQVSNGREGKVRLLNVVMQLRKCANHPYLFEGAEPGPPYTTDQHLLDNAGKMAILDQLLARLKQSGSRVLLFSQMSRMLDILEDYLQWRGYEYCRIDGQTPHEERIEAIDEYNRPGSDNDWNPQVDLQAQDRAHRIGQQKQVCVFRFVTEHSIEEKVVERALQKLRLDQLVIQQGRLTASNKALTQTEMLAMIRHGAERLFDESELKGDDPLADLEAVLRRGEERTRELMGKYANAGLDDLQRFSIDATVDTSAPLINLPTTTSNNFIDDSLLHGRRQARATNYSVDGYYKQAMGTGGRGTSRAARAPMPKGLPTLSDHCFFPETLRPLIEQEIRAYQRSQGYVIPMPEEETEIDSTVSDSDDEAYQQQQQGKKRKAKGGVPQKASLADRIAQRNAEQALIDQAVDLTPAQLAQKEALIAQGFPHWTRRDYNAFLRAVERGDGSKEDYEGIAEEMGTGKTPEEVAAYSQVFWKRWSELADAERIQSLLTKNEARLRQEQRIRALLKRKVTKAGPLVIGYFAGRGKAWSEEEDVFLLEQMHLLGYCPSDALWSRIRSAILTHPSFHFDWFIKTRTTQEIAKRATKLVSWLEKDAKSPSTTSTTNYDEEDEEVAEERKKKGSGVWARVGKLVKEAAPKSQKRRTK